MPRRLVVHVGGHKTGSTFLQQTLLRSYKSLQSAAGVYVPRTGTNGLSSPHQNLAWELSGDGRYRASMGSIAELSKELSDVGEEIVFLSSEDFNVSLGRDRFRQCFVQLATDLNARLEVVAVVREQTGQINSMYTQQVKTLFNSRSFAENLRENVSYRHVNYMKHYAAIFSDSDVTLTALPYSSLDRENPLETVLNSLTIDASGVSFSLPGPEAKNSLVGPLQIAAARLITQLANTSSYYGTDQSRNIRKRFLELVIDSHAESVEGFWGWNPSDQNRLAERYRSSNEKFAERFFEQPWAEPVTQKVRNEAELSDPVVRRAAWALIDPVLNL